MLGKSESVTGFADLFTLVDRKHRICAKNPATPSPWHDLSAVVGYGKAVPAVQAKLESRPRFDARVEADRIILSQYAPPGLVVNDNLRILHFRGQCSPYLSPTPGEASLGVLRMVRPEFTVELRTALHRARKLAAAVRTESIRAHIEGRLTDVCLEVIPIRE